MRFDQDYTGGQHTEKAACAPKSEGAGEEQQHAEAGADNKGHRPNQSIGPHVQPTLMRGGQIGHIGAGDGHGDHFAQGKEDDGKHEQGQRARQRI